MSLEEQLQLNTEALEANTDAANAMTEVLEKLATGTPSTSAAEESEVDHTESEETAAEKKKRVAKEKREAKKAAKDAKTTGGSEITDDDVKNACATAVKNCGGDRALATMNVKKKIDELGKTYMKKKNATAKDLDQGARKVLLAWLDGGKLLEPEDDDLEF